MMRAPLPSLFRRLARFVATAAAQSPLHVGLPAHAGPHVHAEVEGQWVFRCQQPGALKTLKVGLFEQSRHLRRIEVQRLNSQGQSRLTLTRPNDTIALNGPKQR